MSINTAISMEPIKEKLRNLPQYMPKESEMIYKFGEFLADRLNPRLNPMGFNLAAELALSDLERGIDGYSNQPIKSKLVGQHPMTYALLNMSLRNIADAICPEDFARDVRYCQEQINERLRKQ